MALLGDADVRACCAGRRYGDARSRSADQDYLTHHLRVAQEFATDTAARGHGIVSTIH